MLKTLGVRVIRVNAEERFLTALKGESDPERKRKIIGRTFIEVFEEQAAQLKDVRFLAQGTIYPDVIESAGADSGKAHVIKSHHNGVVCRQRCVWSLSSPYASSSKMR